MLGNMLLGCHSFRCTYMSWTDAVMIKKKARGEPISEGTQRFFRVNVYSCSSSSLLATFSEQNFFSKRLSYRRFFSKRLSYSRIMFVSLSTDADVSKFSLCQRICERNIGFLEIFILVGNCIFACSCISWFLACNFRINILIQISLLNLFQRYLIILRQTIHKLRSIWKIYLWMPPLFRSMPDYCIFFVLTGKWPFHRILPNSLDYFHFRSNWNFCAWFPR